MSFSSGVTDVGAGLVRPRNLRPVGAVQPGGALDSGLVVPAPPFWADWTLDITFTGGTTQQYEWATEALNECTFPMEALGVKIDVIWGPLPSGSDLRHPYMVTQFTTGDHATIFIPTDADDPTSPLVSGLPNAQADIKEFYKESFIHELGHVTVGATIDSSNRANRAELVAQASALFTRLDTGRRGTPSDWDDPSLSWADEIREAIAEAFKCSFYSNRSKLIYKNRSHWTIGHADWASLLKVWEPGSFDFVNTQNLTASGQVNTEWFFGGSVFESFSGDLTVDWSWMPGGVAKSRFGSFDPGVPTPPTKPPFALNHGWAGSGDDESQTWAFGNISFLTTPPLPHTQSRKGIAVLEVRQMGRAECAAGMDLFNDVGTNVASIGYTYDTTFGLSLVTSYGVSKIGASGHGSAPLLPPALFVIEVDADAGTLTVGVTDGSTDSHGRYVYADSLTGPIGDGRPQGLYYPQARCFWDLVGDDPGYPSPQNGYYSDLEVGPATWTTYPTLVRGPYPYPPAAIVAGDHRSGLLRVD